MSATISPTLVEDPPGSQVDDERVGSARPTGDDVTSDGREPGPPAPPAAPGTPFDHAFAPAIQREFRAVVDAERGLFSTS